jgi:Na+/proline symporter
MIDYVTEHAITLGLTFTYLLFCLWVGYHFREKAGSGVDSFYVARREIPGWVVSLAFFSTFASTNTYIGQAGKAFQFGLSWAWVGLFWAFFCVISWLVLGPRMRSQTAKLKSMTIPDYFFYRYKSSFARAIRLLSAFVILFATLWYMVGITKGLGHVMASVLDIPYAWGTLAVITVTCAYTVWGGMYSVLWTDAVQGIMMFGVAILMVTLPFIYVGGVDELFVRISNTNHLSADGRPMADGLVTFGSLVSFFYILGIGLAVGMKQIAEPRCLIRFYSVDNAKSMRFAMIWTPVFLGVSLICVMGLGALVHGMVTEEEAAYLIKNTDEVVGFMLARFDNPLVSGICIAGLFAAGMSSLASVMLIVGTAFVQDVWHVVKPMETTNLVRRTRLTILAYTAILYAFTLYPPAGIVEMTAFSGAVFAASFFPAIFGGLYLRWGTDAGALGSMLVGMLACVIWRFAIRFEFDGMSDVHEVIPAFLLSLVTYAVLSRMTRHRIPDAEHLNQLFGKAPNAQAIA